MDPPVTSETAADSSELRPSLEDSAELQDYVERIINAFRDLDLLVPYAEAFKTPWSYSWNSESSSSATGTEWTSVTSADDATRSTLDASTLMPDASVTAQLRFSSDPSAHNLVGKAYLLGFAQKFLLGSHDSRHLAVLMTSLSCALTERQLVEMFTHMVALCRVIEPSSLYTPTHEDLDPDLDIPKSVEMLVRLCVDNRIRKHVRAAVFERMDSIYREFGSAFSAVEQQSKVGLPYRPANPRHYAVLLHLFSRAPGRYRNTICVRNIAGFEPLCATLTALYKLDVDIRIGSADPDGFWAAAPVERGHDSPVRQIIFIYDRSGEEKIFLDTDIGLATLQSLSWEDSLRGVGFRSELGILTTSDTRNYTDFFTHITPLFQALSARQEMPDYHFNHFRSFEALGIDHKIIRLLVQRMSLIRSRSRYSDAHVIWQRNHMKRSIGSIGRGSRQRAISTAREDLASTAGGVELLILTTALASICDSPERLHGYIRSLLVGLLLIRSPLMTSDDSDEGLEALVQVISATCRDLQLSAMFRGTLHRQYQLFKLDFDESQRASLSLGRHWYTQSAIEAWTTLLLAVAIVDHFERSGGLIIARNLRDCPEICAVLTVLYRVRITVGLSKPRSLPLEPLSSKHYTDIIFETRHEKAPAIALNATGHEDLTRGIAEWQRSSSHQPPQTPH